jgi:hypothetical protein
MPPLSLRRRFSTLLIDYAAATLVGLFRLRHILPLLTDDIAITLSISADIRQILPIID